MDKEIFEEAEFAKNHIMNSNLDQRCKKALLRLLNTSTLATNGLSVEEKIQKITEAIQGLVLSQITFLDTVDKKIENANREQCHNCKAMQHAKEVDEEKQKQELISEWKAANGITDDKKDAIPDSWQDVFKSMLLKPYIYIVGCLMAISPYGAEIVKLIIESFAK